uniref:Gypsy retrotransposon integrase-like protein 1 n=1 Tax=Oryzias latipes TaxID=8090 RepID=A0A3B3HBU1_ORYLA
MPVDCVIGRDCPLLWDLLGDKRQTNVVAVVTRSQVKAGLEPLPDLHGDLFEGGYKGQKKTRRQRRQEKHRGSFESLEQKPQCQNFVWDVPNDIRHLQLTDTTLAFLYNQVETETDNVSTDTKCVLDNDILYIQGETGKRLVVPTGCRSVVLHLAHTVPWAGHLGHLKTYARLAKRFYWPGMFKDVRDFCASCPQCQLTSLNKVKQAPLHPLPVISTPFQRIAMDIVGPLEKSSSGNKYILVICDYATRFPEAFPLRTIKTKAIINALVQLFSRVGVPSEILTDQGTNFTSNLMLLLHKELGIKGIRTTPYHPQTDGLVERFNQSLKQMLRKFVSETGRDWDKWLPFLLFAYREVPQASTGFSPFELLYGWPVQGPLDLLRKEWEASKKPVAEGILSYVLQMRNHLEKYRDLAQENLTRAQRDQKSWYDKKARQRELEPGKKVLILLPLTANKLLAKWQGPYEVIRRVGPVTYEIAHPDKGKHSQIYHVNLLKEWKDREQLQSQQTLMVCKIHEDGDDPITCMPDVSSMQPRLDHLSLQQKQEMLDLLAQVPGLFKDGPGRTSLVQHTIHLKDSAPIRQRPYRIPECLTHSLKEEIKKMTDLGVIEPSESEWSSPVVMVPKKDGSQRLCIDFRKVNAVS